MNEGIWIFVVIVGYLIIGMIIADMILSESFGWFILMLFWLPLILLFVIIVMVISMLSEVYSLFYKTIRIIEKFRVRF